MKTRIAWTLVTALAIAAGTSAAVATDTLRGTPPPRVESLLPFAAAPEDLVEQVARNLDPPTSGPPVPAEGHPRSDAVLPGGPPGRPATADGPTGSCQPVQGGPRLAGSAHLGPGRSVILFSEVWRTWTSDSALVALATDPPQAPVRVVELTNERLVVEVAGDIGDVAFTFEVGGCAAA